MNNRFRILHLRASNFYGGPERQLHMHAALARSSDFELTVSSFTEKGRDPEFIRKIAHDDIQTHSFQVRNPYDPRSVGLVRSYLKENKIDILCTHDYRTQVIGFLATRAIKVKWMAFSRGWTKENLKIRAYNLLDKIILRFADHIAVVSNSQKRKLKRLLIPGKMISVVHNAIDPDKFKDLKRIDLRKRFGLPPGSMICISAGRFSPEKGQVYTVKSAIKAIEQNNMLRFILYGDGIEWAMIKRVIVNSGYDDKILCPGFEKDFMGCLKGADILINSSLSEGLPNIVLEAMSLKIPVVATAVGGVPEMISDGINGYLVPPRDTDSLARKILLMASDNKKAREFAENARERIKSEFTFQNQYQKLTSLYLELLSESGGIG